MINVVHPTNLRLCLKDKTISSQPFHERVRNDKDLWHGFKANIAMAFYDYARQYQKDIETNCLNESDLHEIANEAAEHFLRLWTSG